MAVAPTNPVVPKSAVSVPAVPGGTMPVRIESSSSHVAEGQTVDLNCVVPGQAHAQVTWHKRGGSLPTHHQVWELGAGNGGRVAGWGGPWSESLPPSPQIY